jgi:hypothetical protein
MGHRGIRLRTWAYRVFGNLPVAAVDTALVVKAFDPIGALRQKPPAGFVGESRRSWLCDRPLGPGGENPARPLSSRKRTLAHKVANRVELAYRWSDLFEKRRASMRNGVRIWDQAWLPDHNIVLERNS